jgi:predicted nucleic-acid-binding protein
MKSVDTNVLVRLITDDEPQQTSSAERFVRDGVWVSMLALAETVWVLDSYYRMAPKDLMDAVEMLLNHRDLVLQDSEAVRAALDQFRARPSLGFSDCLMLEMARRAGHLPLGTFDRNLAKLEGVQKL